VRVPSPPAVWLPNARPGRQIVTPSIEAAEALQGFDPGWTASAPARDRWKLVGNAVSTRVAQWVGEQLVRRDEAQGGVWQESLIPDEGPWPIAARSVGGKRWAVAVSEFPRRAPAHRQQTLAALLLEHGSEPLSYRATKGFRDRLVRSHLRYRVDFLQALEDHVGYYES
jgi:DNA (cytosine-5)-methyltransferase 1